MRVLQLHGWDVNPGEAIQIQKEIRSRVQTSNGFGEVRRVAGVDVGLKGNLAKAAAVVLSFPDLKLIEVRSGTRAVKLPYIPGLLSFREAPAVLAALQDVESDPDVIFVDGQGIAHPRRLGIASHIGVLVDKPTIGCAKSLLCGTHDPVGETVGSYSVVIDDSEVIGAALRTKTRTKPMYISIGHKIDLETAIELVLACSCGYRLPEPTRVAHLAAADQVIPGGCLGA